MTSWVAMSSQQSAYILTFWCIFRRDQACLKFTNANMQVTLCLVAVPYFHWGRCGPSWSRVPTFEAALPLWLPGKGPLGQLSFCGISGTSGTWRIGRCTLWPCLCIVEFWKFLKYIKFLAQDNFPCVNLTILSQEWDSFRKLRKN